MDVHMVFCIELGTNTIVRLTEKMFRSSFSALSLYTVGLNRRYPPLTAAMTKNPPLPMFLDVVLHKKSIGAISGGS